jgi:chain length determinant protein (polysaccharide antigen chain regulator)
MQSPHTSSSTDEIDLRDLIQTLWSSKWTIALFTLIVAAAAAAYAFLSTPIYETRVQTLPPPPSGLAEYNMANQLSGPAIATLTGNRDNAVPALDPREAYAVFLRHVASVSLRQEFFNDIYLPAQANYDETPANRERLWRRFNKQLTVKLPRKPEDNELMVLTLEGEKPQEIAQWANEYTQMAISAARTQLLDTIKSAINLRISSAEEQIKVLRENARIDRQNRIAQLTEALAVAEATGLETPVNTGSLILSFNNESNDYLRGAKALRAELEQLKNRESDDPFIPKLSELRKIQTLLKAVSLISPQDVSVALIDEIASPPENPTKPRRILILALGVILGGMLGVFIVLTRSFFIRHSV